jgi:hypothetical protein
MEKLRKLNYLNVIFLKISKNIQKIIIKKKYNNVVVKNLQAII